MQSKPEQPFKRGDRVAWERDGTRRTGTVYAVEWVKSDGGFWKVSASWNGEPFHPVTNRQGDFRAASARHFTRI
jgi:hypothetical protein